MRSPADRKRILDFVRAVLEDFLSAPDARGSRMAAGGRRPDILLDDNSPAPVFITLTANGRLRGCVGSLAPESDLLLTLAGTAIQSASRDRRFPPLLPGELAGTRIEVSILSPMEKAADASAIREKTHGVFLRRGGSSGLFLPQVWRQIRSKERFLEELCRSKAGLPPDAWRDPATEIFVFTVEKISE